MSPAMVLAQLSVAREQTGIVTATAVFFRTLGGAIGVAILMSVMWAQLAPRAPPPVPALRRCWSS